MLEMPLKAHKNINVHTSFPTTVWCRVGNQNCELLAPLVTLNMHNKSLCTSNVVLRFTNFSCVALYTTHTHRNVPSTSPSTGGKMEVQYEHFHITDTILNTTYLSYESKFLG